MDELDKRMRAFFGLPASGSTDDIQIELRRASAIGMDGDGSFVANIPDGRVLPLGNWFRIIPNGSEFIVAKMTK